MCAWYLVSGSIEMVSDSAGKGCVLTPDVLGAALVGAVIATASQLLPCDARYCCPWHTYMLVCS